MGSDRQGAGRHRTLGWNKRSAIDDASGNGPPSFALAANSAYPVQESTLPASLLSLRRRVFPPLQRSRSAAAGRDRPPPPPACNGSARQARPPCPSAILPPS